MTANSVLVLAAAAMTYAHPILKTPIGAAMYAPHVPKKSTQRWIGDE